MTGLRSGTLVTVPVTDDLVAVAQVVTTGQTVLLAAFLDLHDAGAPVDVAALDLDDPVLMARIIGIALREGDWPVIGWRPVSPAVHITTYKIGTESADSYHHVDVHGNHLGMIDHETARPLPTSGGNSDACIPHALHGLHGHGPWTRFDEDLVAPRGHPGESCDCQRVIGLDGPVPTDEHAVVATYRLGTDGFGTVAERVAVRAMEERLTAAIEGLGELDGHEFGAGTVTVCCYGPDADVLFAAGRDVLAGLALRPATVVLRYGSDARHTEITL